MLYELAIRFFTLGIRLAALFNAKARVWITGRRQWRKRYRADFQPTAKVLWVHAASLGEFEQGRPVIETFRERFPDWQVVLSFFSPSGYEIRKNYPHATWVCYLPADTRRNAADFLDLIKPDAVLFIKYEFWSNYLAELQKRGIPTLLVSALFRESQPFFRWYGAFWRRMLTCFTHIFVQDQSSADLLQGIGFQNISVAGDTRVDRVLNIAENAPGNDIVAAFAGAERSQGLTSSQALATYNVFIAGSSWQPDEAVFLPLLSRLMASSHLTAAHAWKLIIAPHDPSADNVTRILQSAGPGAIRYSQATPASAREADILIIDNIGLLNTLYRYGTVAYIGGGFGKGIHNTLEPAAFGLPVLFGPKYTKFEEARQFVTRGGAFPVHHTGELAAVLEKLQNPEEYRRASDAVRGYLEQSKGATERILSFLMQIMGKNP